MWAVCKLVQSVPTVMGQVSALTWALTVDPALFVAGPEVVSVAKEAYALADKDEQILLQRLPGRNVSVDVLTQLRVACIDLLNVLMAWEPFRTYPEPVSSLVVAANHGVVDFFGCTAHCTTPSSWRVL